VFQAEGTTQTPIVCPVVGRLKLYPGATKLVTPGGVSLGTMNGVVTDPDGKDAVTFQVSVWRRAK